LDTIKIVDGTLREGEQTPGVIFTREEKLQIARELDRTGVKLLDVGMPAVSAEERETIWAIAHEGLKASIGVSVRMRHEEIDQALQCQANEIFLICPVSRLHIKDRLEIDEDDLQKLAEEMIRHAVDNGLVINLVAEDASRADIPFLIHTLHQAHEAGAQRAFICDTVGISEPFAMKTLINKVREEIPQKMSLGVHCHNDFGLATANTLAAIAAGADYPSVTVNGIGERTGNAPLHEVVVAVEKLFQKNHGVDMHRLYGLSRLVEQCSGIFITPQTPVVGLNAFRHESGIHVDGILKNSETYTGLDPREVNRTPSFVLGKHTGTQTIRHLLEHRGISASEEDLGKILCLVKDRKTAEGKEGIKRMADKISLFYEQCLTFPLESFWKIVEEVLGKDD
jgi:isopropylmalate/homocitrate/citramalate synthase